MAGTMIDSRTAALVERAEKLFPMAHGPAEIEATLDEARAALAE